MMKWRPAALLLLLALPWIGCDETEGEGSGGLEPGSREPEIIEGFICGWIGDDGKPQGIDNDFIADDVVFIWLNWGNVEGNHRVRIIWLDPSDKVIAETSKSFDSQTGRWVTFFFIDTTSSAPRGRWIAEVHIDDDFVRSYAFWIVEE